MNINDPIDLALDTDGDILIDTDLHFSSGVDGVAQAIQIAVSMFAGEWFDDLDEGIPYFLREGVNPGLVILGAKFRAARVLAVFRPVILGVAGVASIDSINATFDRTTRKLTVTWVVRTVFGDTIADSLALEQPNG